MSATRSCSSPAVSEISVGSPSPPPMPLNMKRLRMLRSPATIRKCSQPGAGERIKSFSIADILGRADEERPAVAPTERLQAPQPVVATVAPAMLHPGLHPFLPPALLHSYEQRLAWDYQRQLQEHFQAQLLRQMSLDPARIPIPSEDGSSEERSQRSSSSNGSTDCCTPRQGQAKPEEKSKQIVAQNSDPGQKPAAGADTPLDALFQLSTKNFDEEQGKCCPNYSGYNQCCRNRK